MPAGRLLLIVAVVISLAVGASAGSIFGHSLGKQSRIDEIIAARKQADDAEQQRQRANDRADQAEKKLATQLIGFQQEKQKVEAIAASLTKDLHDSRTALDKITKAETKKAADKAIEEKPTSADQNDQVVNFIDRPNDFRGKELTARVKYGRRDPYYKSVHSLREWLEREGNRDNNGNPVIHFHGYGPGSAMPQIDLAVGIPLNIEVPEAKYRDELLVTFKCGRSATEGNIATKITRPK